jgi:hypothetical protein
VLASEFDAFRVEKDGAANLEHPVELMTVGRRRAIHPPPDRLSKRPDCIGLNRGEPACGDVRQLLPLVTELDDEVLDLAHLSKECRKHLSTSTIRDLAGKVVETRPLLCDFRIECRQTITPSVVCLVVLVYGVLKARPEKCLVDLNAEVPHLPKQIREDEDLTNPINFAENAHAWMASGFEELIDRASPEQFARFQRARYALVKQFPALQPRVIGDPLVDLEEAANALWLDAFSTGLRAGAHCESLRLSLLAPSMMCRNCWGVGLLGPDGERYPDAEGEPCPDCEGRGFVPTPGVRALKAA